MANSPLNRVRYLLNGSDAPIRETLTCREARIVIFRIRLNPKMSEYSRGTGVTDWTDYITVAVAVGC